MCNLYSIRLTQADIRTWFDVADDAFGNLAENYQVYPDYPAPIGRIGADGRRLIARARWGMPTPPKFLEGKKADPGVTNIRNLASPHWRRWLGPECRCVVPMTAFSEYETTPEGKKVLRWFEPTGEPLAWFAGIWTTWTSTRKVREGEVSADIFAFLTTEPNAVVAPIHAKAMPVILRTREEVATWLAAPAAEALALQRPLPDEALRLVSP